MSRALADQHCKPCEGGVEPLPADQAELFLTELDGGWLLTGDGRSIRRRFRFPTYSRTLGFANAVAWIAISEGHHPEIVITYDNCDVRWTTFAIGGLSENDFICAAKTDRLLK